MYSKFLRQNSYWLGIQVLCLLTLQIFKTQPLNVTFLYLAIVWTVKNKIFTCSFATKQKAKGLSMSERTQPKQIPCTLYRNDCCCRKSRLEPDVPVAGSLGDTNRWRTWWPCWKGTFGCVFLWVRLVPFHLMRICFCGHDDGRGNCHDCSDWSCRFRLG